jgi:hypothetical protein
MEAKADDPSLTLSELVKEINKDASKTTLETMDIRQWVKMLSDENRGVWFQEDSENVMFI